MKPATILITGASRGIGRAIALRFAREGYHIAATACTDEAGLCSLKEEILAMHGSCLTFLADAASHPAMEAVVGELLRLWGHIDILVNNAGIASLGLFTDMTSADYERLISVNLLSVLHCCSLCVPSMVKRRSGRIINISSVWGISGASCEAAYSASKGGVNSFTRALAKELAPSGIAVNALACGVVDTQMNRAHLTEDELEALAEQIPAGRAAAPEEAADAVWQLALSPLYLTGQIIAFDGGFL
ncbi:MAG: SDR family NAD(P)-dependent oxidoreductase [Lachnospiraceae bacterium]|nr:SDR family NAD(P)-dependent oxidoreductase [Lachnospiraceae bacterium]